jgi:transcriptional regulator of acetoin/glycerol metabolism
LKLLENYTWPGNVRELTNMVERIIATNDKGTISASDIIQIIGRTRIPKSSLVSKNDEVDAITQALQKARCNQADAASMLGISRTTLWRKMNKYQLNLTDSRNKHLT